MSAPSSAAERTWVENRPTRSAFPLPARQDLVTYRELALILALRDLKVRYKQTVLGVLWAVVQPLAGVVLFTLVFGRLVDLPSDGLPYAVFVYAGLLCWQFFAASVDRATSSLVENESLVSDVWFPRIIAPLAAVFPGLVDLALSFVILLVFMLAYGVAPGVEVVAVPLVLAALVVFTAGVGSLFAALYVQYRDVGHALSFLTQLWLFASPVVYPSSLVDGWERYLLYANPMAGIVETFRWALVDGPGPGAAGLVSLATGVLIAVAGVAHFQRTERRFADVI
jgi:lipopolysaccharide transport system permease protein